MKIDVGPRQYELVEGWGNLPDGWRWGQCAGVACDSENNVHVYTRTEHPLMIFDRKGNLVDHWGEGLFEHPHGICITPNDDVYFVETVTHLVTKFNKAGRHLLSIGTRHQPSDTGYTKDVRVDAGPLASGGGMPIINGTARGAGPFHQPTDISIAQDNGDIYVSDGYRNSRVHKFNKEGELLASVGEPGNAQDLKNTKDGANLFHTPHGIWTHKDRVYVCDRENYRIQVYDRDLNHLDIWTGFERPTKIYMDANEVLYVSELEDRFSLVNLDGTIIGSYGSERSNDPGKFWGPHCIWADSEESIYVAEVLNGQRIQKFARVK
ncbi:MAG TPA: peptidyl-alpha-hydroxyglycine alpha-amidating lyase family protein [Dehalococcoidia bacterium]|nr:peptidyl-alpha-hydroxyglycine alpha-amidating lyase family protein [Dehalococcoidia bacterium]